MASVSTRKHDGSRRVLFNASDGRRRTISVGHVSLAVLAQELGEAHTEESLRWWTLTVLSVLVALTSLQLDKPASQPERTKRKAPLGLATTAIDQLFMDEVPWEPGMWRNPVLT